ncbi:MAG: hypothetical protein WC989_07815 [Micavibrio sp.]
MDYIGRNPNDMAGSERYAEVIALMANAIIQHKNNKRNQLNSPNNERSLTGLPSASKHSCPNRKPLRVRAEKGAKQ